MHAKTDLTPLIYGSDPAPGLVAVEPCADTESAGDRVQLFRRTGAAVEVEEQPFRPFLWLRDARLLDGYDGDSECRELRGANALRCLAVFPSWDALQQCVTWLKSQTGRNPSDPSSPFFLINDPVQQFLMATGRTFFKGMVFEDLLRMQVDIETLTADGYEFPNPERQSDRIVAIALSDSSGWEHIIRGDRLDEKKMLQEFVRIVAERDPDVIEGHNIFKFDIPYLATRAKQCRVKLAIGRDGSVPSMKSGRLIIAERAIAYPKIDVFGRHVVDTFFLAQAYDVSHRSLESLSLKDVAIHFGVAAPDRTYIDGEAISATFRSDPERLMRYAMDDIRETRAVSDLLSPSYFVQAQMLPFSYQNVCVRGNATKIDALLLREYLAAGASIPLPDNPREFAGGYTDIFMTGVYHDVHHCDVRSLYPSILLARQMRPRTDERKAFLSTLGHLRALRLDARRRMQDSRGAAERHHLDALQSTLKILINSFYGYLGFSQARFSDFDVAEKVTAEGRATLQHMVDWIREHGGQPIEMDTDGIYFLAPEGANDRDLQAFERGLQASLPSGIEVEFDGRYPAMFSYKMKNYALLEESGEVVIKGAALKSRGLEPFQRQFMEEWLKLKLESRDAEIPALVSRYRDAIENREWPIRMLAKTETLQDAPSTYQAKRERSDRNRNAAYELALASGRDYRSGDQVSYYVTGNRKNVAVHSSAKLVSDWDPANRDENVTYYLGKLDALCRKFDAVGEGPTDRHPEFDFGQE